MIDDSVFIVSLVDVEKNAQWFRQLRKFIVLTTHSGYASAEGLYVLLERFRRVSIRVNTDENYFREWGVRIGPCDAVSGLRELMQRKRANVRAIREAEKNHAPVTPEGISGERLIFVVGQSEICQRGRSGQHCGMFGQLRNCHQCTQEKPGHDNAQQQDRYGDGKLAGLRGSSVPVEFAAFHWGGILTQPDPPVGIFGQCRMARAKFGFHVGRIETSPKLVLIQHLCPLRIPAQILRLKMSSAP